MENTFLLFLQDLRNGGIRVILNLQQLNNYVVYEHLKIEAFNTALLLIEKNCSLASIDLKDANYSFAIHHYDQKYLRFMYDNHFFEYTCLPNGLSCVPCVFTNIP